MGGSNRGPGGCGVSMIQQLEARMMLAGPGEEPLFPGPHLAPVALLAGVSASLRTLPAGQPVRLTAVPALAATIESVRFYRETNGTPDLQLYDPQEPDLILDTLIYEDFWIDDGWEMTIPTTILPPGTYTFYAEADSGGSTDVRSVTVTVEPGCAIEGRLWHDLDPNGVHDASEPALAGWQVYLDVDQDGALTDGEPNQLTLEDGSYRFSGLNVGTYTVGVVGMDAWQFEAAATAEAPVLEYGPVPDLASLDFPMRYDLRDVGLNAIRNQGDCGTCWAFAAMGAIESAILKAGVDQVDLSENHLKNTYGHDPEPCDGGDQDIVLGYLARLSGPVLESDDPYFDYDNRISPGGPVAYCVRDAMYLDTTEEIKGALMTYGAVVTAMYIDDAYFDEGRDTYYYNGPETYANHDVAIVGWDDTKLTGARNPGAWLVRNSYGTNWGMGGYLWISYDDVVVPEDAICYGNVTQVEYSSVYTHAPAGPIAAIEEPWACVAFTASREEPLTAVSFHTLEDGASFEIEIHRTIDGGPAGLLASESGTCAYKGYHTIDLTTPVELSRGQQFFVVLHLTDGGDEPQAISRSDYEGIGYKTTATAAPGNCFFSDDGGVWADLTNEDPTASFCIQAYTGKVDRASGQLDVRVTYAQTARNVDFFAFDPASQPQAEIVGEVFTVAERSSVTLSGAGLAVGAATIAAYEWDLDYDGEVFQADATGAAPSFNAAGIDGPATRTIALRVRDSAGVYSEIVPGTVQIENAAAAISIANPGSGQEGSPLSMTATIEDVAGDVAAIQWQLWLGEAMVAESNEQPFTFTCADNGAFTVRLVVEDKDGAIAEQTMPVTIQNVAPVLEAAGAASVEIGQPYSLTLANVSDPGTDAVSEIRVDWGDGSQIESFAGTGVAQHAYAAEYGEYTICTWVVDEDGMHATATKRVSVTPPPRTIGGRAFNDVNGNGVMDDGEAGLAACQVFLDLDRNGKRSRKEPMVLTDDNGSYEFQAVPAGSHRVRMVTPKRWRHSVSGAVFSDVALAEDSFVLGRNFALTQKASISGKVFADHDWNGKQAADEPGIRGLQIYVDANNNAVLDAGEQSVFTDEDGNFELSLEAGRHVLRLIPLSNSFCRKPKAGVMKLKVAAGKVLTGRNFALAW